MSDLVGQRYPQQPLVSVIMNCLNCERYLEEAIDSVYDQTYENWEIIFWDNASTDGSAAIARKYDEKLLYFCGEHTVPLGEARNQAIKRSRGKFIAFLDCDDLWLPTKLEKQVPLFKRNPRVGLVFSDTVFFNEKGVSSQLYKKQKPPRGNVFRELLINYFLSLETVVIRERCLVNADHWFDGNFNLIEEADLFRRLAYRWEVDYVDEPLAKYRLHSASWSFNRQELWPRETERMLEKYSSMFDSFEENYGGEIAILRSKIDYHYAIESWKTGEGLMARKLLKAHAGLGGKFILVYMFSFFPYAWFDRVLTNHRNSL